MQPKRNDELEAELEIVNAALLFLCEIYVSDCQGHNDITPKQMQQFAIALCRRPEFLDEMKKERDERTPPAV
jgi:hypothetical protein